MAPMPALRTPSGEHIRQISQSISYSIQSRSSTEKTTSLASIFAILDQQISSIASRALQSLSHVAHILPKRTVPQAPESISKRQGILAIPTTYSGLNSGPAPGAVVGIVLGAIAGFLFALWFVYTILRLSGRFGGTTIIEEEVIRRRSRSRSRSKK